MSFSATYSTIALVFFLTGSGEVLAQNVACSEAPGFNKYMCKAQQRLLRDRANLGWSEAPAMTRSYPFGRRAYGQVVASVVRNPRGKRTDISCNGAVFETLVVALMEYAGDNPSWIPSDTLDLRQINEQTLTTLRGHIMLVKAVEMAPFKGRTIPNAQLAKVRSMQSTSIAEGINKFGVGDVINDQKDYAPGDIVTFDRDVKLLDKRGKVLAADGTGHSGVFVGWIGGDQKVLPYKQYNAADTKGFVYFSSQTNYVRNTSGKLVEVAGLGLRAGYFLGFCPQDPGNKRDPGKKNCMDQRVQDEPAYQKNPSKYKQYPRMTGDLRPDCCIKAPSVRVGRVRAIEKWSVKPSVESVRNQCDATARVVVGRPCPRP